MQITEKDMVNVDQHINGYADNAYVIRDHGFLVCVSFGDDLGDALDNVVDYSDHLDPWKIYESELDDYDEDSLRFLGNYSIPYDISGLDITEVRNPDVKIVLELS